MCHNNTGMGIHNEPGFKPIRPYPGLPTLVATILDAILSTRKEDPDRGFLESLQHDGKDEVVLLVNNLGSISQLEMGSIVKEGMLTLPNRM
jgi:dihydroxyacetone kinase